MIRTIERGMDFLTDHYLAVCLFIALFILTWAGVGDIPTVSVLGMILCLAGFARQAVLVDLWILFPLILYNLAGMVSSYAAYRNITDGYASLHLVYPVIYLLMACLEEEEVRLLRRLCVVWAGVVAAAGIGSFVSRAVLQGSAGRMEGFPGNPNATGIFLVLGWFALMGCDEEEEEKESVPSLILSCVEPLLLIALALTLSMGSFTAMAVGILVVLTGKRKGSSGREIFRYACRLLSGASLGVGTGVLLYLAAARTSVAWICLPLLVYGLAVVLCWNKYKRFLKEYPWMAVIISVCGLMVAAAVIAVRPGSVATFTERLEMMRNGLGYLVMHPLTGVGPYQWRILNLHDSDKYFNTWHIHNVLLHVGVEQGWIAMGTLLFMAARFFGKKPELWKKAGFTAFCIHNMMDTSFFYMSIMALMMIDCRKPPKGWQENDKCREQGSFWDICGYVCLSFVFLYYPWMRERIPVTIKDYTGEKKMESGGRNKEFRSIWLLLAGFGVSAAVVLMLCFSFAAGLPDTVGRPLTAEEAKEVTERNSSLTAYIYLSPNADFPREKEIRKITIHHMAGDFSLEELGETFSRRDRRASSNYAIDGDGRVALYVEESNRAWTSGSRDNDNQAVTVEVANDEMGGDWHVGDNTYAALIELCTDICLRNGIEELQYTGDAEGNLTIHKMFTGDTECPGPYLESKMEEIAREVNSNLR